MFIGKLHGIVPVCVRALLQLWYIVYMWRPTDQQQYHLC